jgi:hypothetical protein
MHTKRIKDLIGCRFGKLTVVSMLPTFKWGRPMWNCLCDCGGTKVAGSGSLQRGETKHCGCVLPILTVRSAGYLRAHNSWRMMCQRCLYPTAVNYARYGGAGVKICKRWFVFSNFLADMGERPSNTTLGRFADTGDYTPDNCAWQTRAQQWVERKHKHGPSGGN